MCPFWAAAPKGAMPYTTEGISSVRLSVRTSVRPAGQDSGASSQASGASSQASGASSQASGASSQASGVSS